MNQVASVTLDTQRTVSVHRSPRNEPTFQGGAPINILTLRFLNGEKRTSIPVSEESAAALVACLLNMLPQGHTYPKVTTTDERTNDHE